MNKFAVIASLLLMLPGFVCAQDATYELDGLKQPAEIIVDEWGVPHIYANTHYDAFFVQDSMRPGTGFGRSTPGVDVASVCCPRHSAAGTSNKTGVRDCYSIVETCITNG